jgi:hypothetical protein
MVQVIENLTQLVGTIVDSRSHPQLGDYDIVTIDIERAEPVEGKADLLALPSGSRVDVTVRHALLGAAAQGARIHFRAKRTIDGVMCEPNPEPGNFRIE